MHEVTRVLSAIGQRDQLGRQEAAQAMGIGRRQADRLWTLARAWLFRRISEGPD